MAVKLAYVIEFVADMGKAVAFYRDTLGLKLRFESPQWSEFDTGATTFALHPASAENRPGRMELGFNVEDLEAVRAALSAKGVKFTMAPTKQEFGGKRARFLDSEGARVTLG